jgi:hypothetical protein
MNKLVRAVGGAAVLSLALAPAAFAQTGGGCQLAGTANFSQGLSLSSHPFDYGFSGNLTGCHSSDSTAPGTGTVSAGESITIGGTAYQEPTATGSGSCANSTTNGIAIVSWADGTNTVIKYSTSGVAAAVALTGSVIPSVSLPAVSGTGSTTVSTTRYAGGSSLGALAFQPPSPTDCNTATGVTSAGISGVVGLGAA